MTLVNGELRFTEKTFAESTGLEVVGYQGIFERNVPNTGD